MERVGGDITTLLDLTPRDRQDNDLFPLNTDQTWFTRDPDRRIIPSVPLIADFPFRGPATFGQRFTHFFQLEGFDNSGDLFHVFS